MVNGDGDVADDEDDKANPLSETLSAAQLHKVLHPRPGPGVDNVSSGAMGWKWQWVITVRFVGKEDFEGGRF